MGAKILSTAAIIILISLALMPSARAARLACFYFDKNDPLQENSPNFFGTTLPFEWAKNFLNREDFLEGQQVGGFFEVNNLSKTEAQNSCLDSLRKSHPKAQIKLMNMAARTTLWSKPMPAIFLKDESGKYTKMVIIGDSLSDQGKIREMLKVLPGKPYFAGRFSNGAVWPDYLHEMAGISIQNLATAGSLSGRYQEIDLNQNKPWSQRLPDSWGLYFSGTFKDQFETFKKSLNGQSIKNDTIFLIWGGSNDYLAFLEETYLADIFIDLPDHKYGYNNIVDRVTDNILAIIKGLYALGGRTFLIPNLPNLGKLPRMFENTAYAKGVPSEKRLVTLSNSMSKISNQHNILLQRKLDELKKDLEINVTLVDIFGELNRVAAPLSYMAKEISFEGNLASIGQACFSSYSYYGFRKGPVCKTPEVFFWDGVHPTTYGHCLLAWLIHQYANKSQIFKPSSLEDYLGLYRSTWKTALEAK